MDYHKLMFIIESTGLHPVVIQDVIYYYEKQKNILNHIRNLIIPFELSQELVCKIIALYTAVESEEKTTYLTIPSSMNFGIKDSVSKKQKEQLNQISMIKKELYTENGIEYEVDESSGPDGLFFLKVNNGTSKEEIKKAKAWLEENKNAKIIYVEKNIYKRKSGKI